TAAAALRKIAWRHSLSPFQIELARHQLGLTLERPRLKGVFPASVTRSRPKLPPNLSDSSANPRSFRADPVLLPISSSDCLTRWAGKRLPVPWSRGHLYCESAVAPRPSALLAIALRNHGRLRPGFHKLPKSASLVRGS